MKIVRVLVALIVILVVMYEGNKALEAMDQRFDSLCSERVEFRVENPDLCPPSRAKK